MSEKFPNSNETVEQNSGNKSEWEKVMENPPKFNGENLVQEEQYFSTAEMRQTLMDEVDKAEQDYWKTIDVAKRTDIDGYFNDRGGIVVALQEDNKQLMKNVHEAESNREYAKRDFAVYDLLETEYFNTQYSGTEKKADFVSVVDGFVEDHTKQIDQLLVESKSLAKGTPEYVENRAKYRQLVQERDSARMIKTRFFGDSES